MHEYRKVFPGVTRDELNAAVDVIHRVDVDFGTDLVQLGERDRTALLLLEGEVSLRVGEIEIATCRAGEMTGEMEFFGPEDRFAGARAVSNGVALVVEREAYESLRRAGNGVAWEIERMVLAQAVRGLRQWHVRIAELARGTPSERVIPRPGFVERVSQSLFLWTNNPGRGLDRVQALRQVPLFEDASEAELADLAAAVRPRAYKAGQVVCRNGDPADYMFFLVGGAVEVMVTTSEDRGNPLAILEPGSVFGFTSMVAERPRMATCIAQSDVVLLTLDKARWDELAHGASPGASALRRAVAADLGFQGQVAVAQLVALEKDVREKLAEEMALKAADEPERELGMHDLLFKG